MLISFLSQGRGQGKVRENVDIFAQKSGKSQGNILEYCCTNPDSGTSNYMGNAARHQNYIDDYREKELKNIRHTCYELEPLLLQYRLMNSNANFLESVLSTLLNFLSLLVDFH